MSALGLGGYFEQEDANEESSEDEESLDQDNSPNGKTNNVEGSDDPIQAGCSASAKLEVSTDGVQGAAFLSPATTGNRVEMICPNLAYDSFVL